MVLSKKDAWTDFVPSSVQEELSGGDMDGGGRRAVGSPAESGEGHREQVLGRAGSRSSREVALTLPKSIFQVSLGTHLGNQPLQVHLSQDELIEQL